MADGGDGEGRALRRAFGAFPTGVTVVTTRDAGGRPVGMTANSFTSVSLDPPLVLVCVAERASSYAAFTSARCFAVNVLTVAQEPTARLFASRGVDRFAGSEIRREATGAPVLTDVAAWFDCAVHDIRPAGDHALLIGRVEAFGRDPDARPLGWSAGRFVDPAGAVRLIAVARRGDEVLARRTARGLALPASGVWGPAEDPASLLGQLGGLGAPSPVAGFDDGPARAIVHALEVGARAEAPAGAAFASIDRARDAFAGTSDAEALRLALGG